MSERVKVNVKVSSEVNTILHDLFNQIQYELCEQYEDEIERLKSQLDFIGEQNKYIDKLEKLLQQKENIIKEVKEKLIDLFGTDDEDINKILKILDKGNDKVEIIEDKKIEKLDIRNEKNCKNNWKWKVYGEEHGYNISTPQKIIADKINEIIDYINKEDNK